MINHGVTGPNVRAAGHNYDVRWAHPYSVYDELDWEPAVERPSIKGRLLRRQIPCSLKKCARVH